MIREPRYVHIVNDYEDRGDAYTEKDYVNKPSHYVKNGLQCINVIASIYGIDAAITFCECNAFKYLFRCNDKGKKDEDLAKAKKYLSMRDELKEKGRVD